MTATGECPTCEGPSAPVSQPHWPYCSTEHARAFDGYTDVLAPTVDDAEDRDRRNGRDW